MRERSTYGENPAITSTPLAGRTEFQPYSYSNNVQQLNYNCTPIVQSGSVTATNKCSSQLYACDAKTGAPISLQWRECATVRIWLHRQQNVNRSPATSSASSSTKRTLLISDSILSPINLKGIVKAVQKHSKSGAKINDIVEDITSYNIKSFRAVVLSVGGNGASNNTDIELFEEKYDQLTKR